MTEKSLTYAEKKELEIERKIADWERRKLEKLPSYGVYTTEEFLKKEGLWTEKDEALKQAYEAQGEPIIRIRVECMGVTKDKLEKELKFQVGDDLGKKYIRTGVEKIVDQWTFGIRNDGERMCRGLEAKLPLCKCKIAEETTTRIE